MTSLWQCCCPSYFVNPKAPVTLDSDHTHRLPGQSPLPPIFLQPIGKRMFCSLSFSFGVYTSGEHQSRSPRITIGAYKCLVDRLFSLIGWLFEGAVQGFGWRCCCKWWRNYFVGGGPVWDFTLSSTYGDAKKLGIVALGNVYGHYKLILAGKLNGTMKTISARPFKVSSDGILWLLALTLANVSYWLARLEEATC